jgi:hypothetical protein
MSRFLLVTLVPEVDMEARNAAWKWIWMGPAVSDIDDLECVSRTTLDERLLPAEQSLVGPRVRQKKR